MGKILPKKFLYRKSYKICLKKQFILTAVYFWLTLTVLLHRVQTPLHPVYGKESTTMEKLKQSELQAIKK